MKLSEVHMEKLMEALPSLSTNYTEEEAISFNLLTEVEEGRVPRSDWHMSFDAEGKVECGEGHVEDAITFNLRKGGLNVLIGMMLDGLSGTPRSAMMAMMMGKVGIEPFNQVNIKKTESFFKRVEIGEEPLKKALAAVGIEITEIDV